MRELVSSLKGREIKIHVVESADDLPAFRSFVEANKELLGFDTETTGLDWWNAGNGGDSRSDSGFYCRLAQFGNGWESYVLPVELGEVFVEAMAWALSLAHRLVMQNRGYDIHVVEACFGVDSDMLLKKTWDTKIFAHLVDPRAVKEGGIGLKLEELVPHYVDAEVGAAVKKSMTEIVKELNKAQPKVPAGFSCRDQDDNKVRIALDGIITTSEDGEYVGRIEEEVTRELLKLKGYKFVRAVSEPKDKITKENVWKKVPLDHEGYLLYAGMDPIFAFRLLKILFPLVPARSMRKGLITWEHVCNYVTYQMEKTGYLVDREYAEARIKELIEEERTWSQVVKTYGVENVGSNDQLIEAFTRLGVKLKDRTDPTERHPEGQFKMDESVLSKIEHPLAEAVMKAKSASKKRTNWFEKALNSLDPQGKVHASINSLLARTARMSVTGAIPAQTLPAGDGYVRHCFLADPGELVDQYPEDEEWVTASIDFGNMELRVLAAASGDETMLEIFWNNGDLHNMTAIAAFGPMPEGAEKHPKRKAGKGTNFTVCFGGGWNAVHTQWGISEEDAKKAVAAFWKAYPGAKRLSDKLQNEARRTGYVYTATGRRIPVDPKRPYAALNYYIQSSARDITVRALIELFKAGYGPMMRLPIHDEIVFSFPKSRAKELTEKAARIMEFTFKGLLIPADGEIGQQSWGSVMELEDSKH